MIGTLTTALQQPTLARGSSPPDQSSEKAAARAFGLRAQLLVLLASVLLPWLVLLIYTQADERKAAIADVSRDAMRLIRIASSNQAAHIEASKQLLTALSQLPQLSSKNAATCNSFLSELLKSYPWYLDFGVVEPNGNIRCSAVPMRPPVNVADRPFFKRALATLDFTIGDYSVSSGTQLPAINYAYPISSGSGDVDGVLYVTHSLSWLVAALANVDFPRGVMLAVTDGDGTVLARLPNETGWVGKTLPEHDVIQALRAHPRGGVFASDDAKGVRTLWAHAPLIERQALHATIGVPEAVAFADIDRRLLRNLAGFLIVTLGAVTAAWFGARHFIFRQVDALVAASRKLAIGNLAARAPVLARRSELGVLARAFNSMGETLEARDRELRQAEERTRKVEVELAVTRAEIEIAREIQRCLLPEDPLAIADVRMAGRCIPAVGVGGDYFGYFPRGGDRIDNFIGDVSGHGVGAAMLMAEARTIFLAERLVEVSAAPIMGKLNDLLYEDLGRANHFMSACCATFDTATRELKYANAGHPPALLLRAGETRCGTLEADGMLLGMDKAARFTEATVTLESRDIVVFYTDGITERESEAGEFFGVERLKDVVIAHRDEEPEVLIASVLSAVDGFAGARPNEDDVTIVVMQVM